MSVLIELKKEMQELANPEKGKFLQRFFKTAEGEYGYGDIFIGLTVPHQRIIANKYKNLSLEEIEELLQSKIHEERLTALFILGLQFKAESIDRKKVIFDFYLSHTKYINNWDFVDSSADKIVGGYLLAKYSSREAVTKLRSSSSRLPLVARTISILEKLARSESIWERRIAMIATYEFIKQGSHEEALAIAEILVNDKHDLIQKAVGWMLREVGKRCSEEIEESFLKKHYKTMPRTALRYAIERFSENKRRAYLLGKA